MRHKSGIRLIAVATLLTLPACVTRQGFPSAGDPAAQASFERSAAYTMCGLLKPDDAPVTWPPAVGRYVFIAAARTGPHAGSEIHGSFMIRRMEAEDSVARCSPDGTCAHIAIGGFAGDFRSLGANYPRAEWGADSSFEKLFMTKVPAKRRYMLASGNTLHDGLYFYFTSITDSSFGGSWRSWTGSTLNDSVGGPICARMDYRGGNR